MEKNVDGAVEESDEELDKIDDVQDIIKKRKSEKVVNTEMKQIKEKQKLLD